MYIKKFGQEFKAMYWKNEKLNPEMIAIDTETTLITNPAIVPDVVLSTVYDGSGIVYVLKNQDVNNFFEVNKDAKLCFWNAAFDMPVLEKLGAPLEPYLESGRMLDGQILYRLLSIAVRGQGASKWSLDYVAETILKEVLEKDDTIRLTFGQYLNNGVVDYTKISRRHIEYACLDPITTYLVTKRILKQIEVLPTTTNLAHDINLLGDIALSRVTRNGIAIDQPRVEMIRSGLGADKLRNEEILSTYGYVKGKKGNTKVLEKYCVDNKFALPVTDKGKLSTAKVNLQEYAPTHPFIDAYLRFKGFSKAQDFLNNINTSIVHPRYNSILVTGRSSCIAEGQLVSVVGGRKPIEDVQVGELVYSYSKEGKLELKKVINKWNNGVRPTVKVGWRSSVNTGSLICTDDHLVFVRKQGSAFAKKTGKEEGWYKASELQDGDRIYHLTQSISNGRHRLFSADLNGVHEQLIIKQQVFNCYDNKNFHIHHKDENTLNNDISNLEILPAADHAKLHSYEYLVPNRYKEFGENHHSYKRVTKFRFLKDCYKYYTNHPDKVTRGMLKSDAKKLKMSLLVISRRFKNHKMVNSRHLRDVLAIGWREAERQTGKDFRTLRKLAKDLSIIPNHTVTYVEKYKDCVVYDLEVEDNHNFIASELCVHNCTSPNIQQLPRVGGIRECFIPFPGEVFIDCDYAAIELASIASVNKRLFGYSVMGDLINQDKDLHKYAASKIYDVTEENVTKEQRQTAKILNFGLVANMSPETFVGHAAKFGLTLTAEESTRLKTLWAKVFPEMAQYWKRGYGRSTVITDTGFIRSDCSYTEFLNCAMQTKVAEGCKIMLYNLTKAGYKITAFVHDQILISHPIEDAPRALEDVKRIMENSMAILIKGVKVSVDAKLKDKFEK